MDLTQAIAEYYTRGATVFERLNTSLYSKRIVKSLGLTAAFAFLLSTATTLATRMISFGSPRKSPVNSQDNGSCVNA